MNIKQLTTKLQEEGKGLACDTHKEEHDQVKFYHYNEAEIEYLIQNTINQTLAYVSEEVEGMKHLSVHTHNVGRCRVCIRNNALTDIQKILEVKE